jgi:sulfite exporter TauE/SafE
MELWPAFLIGFIGSAHCAGMCGPLALALPGTGNTRSTFIAGRAAYNLGRIATYGLLGAFFGLLGHGFAVAGLQRWVSLVAGAAILIAVATSRNDFALGASATRVVGWLKAGLGKLFRQRTFGALFAIGVLNGFLPCGLVYAACAGAVTTGNIAAGMLYMITFGLGTVPMMLALSFAGQKIQLPLRFRLQKLIPFSLVLVGVLLLLRGMGLGIPYLSPAISGKGSCCH